MRELFLELKRDKTKLVVFVLLLIFFASLITYQIALPAADDMARHLVNGREILQGNFDVLYKNVYSSTMPEAPFVNHHWLSGVVFYLLFIVVGWKGLVVFKVLILFLTFFLLFAAARKKADFWLVALLAIPTIIILAERSALRPEMFSYLFIALFLYLILDWQENPQSKKIWLLVPLQILWVNMHLFFIVGPALVGGFLVEEVALNFKNFWRSISIRKLALLLVFLGLVTLINPNGFTGAIYPLKIFQDYGFNVTENNSLSHFLKTYPHWSNISISLFIPAVALLALSFLFVLRNKKRPIFLLLGGVATAIGGFVIARLLAVFAIFFFLGLSVNLNEYFLMSKNYLNLVKLKSVRATYFTAGVFIILVFSLTLFSQKISVDKKFGVGLTTRAEDAAGFFKKNNLRGPIFNDYDIGSYLVYNLYPGEQVFVDNRPEAYSGKFWRETYEPLIQDEKFWQENLDKFKFNTIFFYRYNAGPKVADFFYRRLNDPAWVLVYADNYAVIYVRNNEENKDVIDKWKITPGNVEARQLYLLKSENYEDMIAAADNFNMVGRTDLGRQVFWQVVARWPDKGKVWKVMADWQLSDNSLESTLLSIMYLERAIDVGYSTPETYTLLAAAYTRAGYLKQAREAVSKALRIDPEYQDALDVLEVIKSRSQ